MLSFNEQLDVYTALRVLKNELKNAKKRRNYYFDKTKKDLNDTEYWKILSTINNLYSIIELIQKRG